MAFVAAFCHCSDRKNLNKTTFCETHPPLCGEESSESSRPPQARTSMLLCCGEERTGIHMVMLVHAGVLEIMGRCECVWHHCYRMVDGTAAPKKEHFNPVPPWLPTAAISEFLGVHGCVCRDLHRPWSGTRPSAQQCWAQYVPELWISVRWTLLPWKSANSATWAAQAGKPAFLKTQ